MKISRTAAKDGTSAETTEIVFAIDEGGEETEPRAIIADLTRDDAWIAVGANEAPELSAWR
ncbi:DUF7556 family protein [Halegenticoccus tardaugens]|uniref:DUF7556 family protein n=1 Tax=Halegenticoccus tardaugens TaxID=2071624 RepID=UPI00100B5F62|nr:hypothetical protein [Halegenticoccus tardaugens]